MPDEVSGSAKEVSDFSSFCEGDLDPTLNKRIRVLIDADSKYIVYLDEDLYCEWSMAEDFELHEDFGNIANTINPALVGGVGTAFGQLFNYNYTGYAAGISIQIPLTNRAAQGDRSCSGGDGLRRALDGNGCH